MLRLSHLLFFPRTWHLIDCTLLSMQIASPWLVCMFVCGKMYLKMVDSFGHVELRLGRFHPLGCVGWGLWVFQSAPHEVPSPAAGSSCCAAAHFLSLTCLPTAPVSLGLVAGEISPLSSFLPEYGGGIWGPPRMMLSFSHLPSYLNPRTSGRYYVLQNKSRKTWAALYSLFPCSKLLLSFGSCKAMLVWTDPVHAFPPFFSPLSF